MIITPPLDEILAIVDIAFKEDIGPGDFTSLATVPDGAVGEAKLLVKDDGVLAGVELAEIIFHRFDPSLEVEIFIHDGTHVKKGDVAFIVRGNSRSILSSERLVLNFMQRMSGIATTTNEYASLIQHLNTKVIDTRKTTPGIRLMEKWAVRIGGGGNHRFALYDMIMIKDNHIDYAEGIENAITRTKQYLQTNNLDLKIEVETRSLVEVEEVLEIGGVDRIMLDNFTPDEIRQALKMIEGRFETEASGGITKETLLAYAETGVDFISVGALTHSVKSLDLSLKADFS